MRCLAAPRSAQARQAAVCIAAALVILHATGVPLPGLGNGPAVCDAEKLDPDATEARLGGCGARLRGLGALRRLRRLRLIDLSDNGLSELAGPAAVVASDTAEVLLLGGNPLRSLPRRLPLPRLRFLGLRGCRFEAFGEAEAAALPEGLEALVLTDNGLASLSGVAAHLPRLRKLMLSHNNLRALPALPESLELLRVATNPLEAPPELARLPRLAWVAAGGTPWAADPEALPAVVPFLPAAEVDAATSSGEARALGAGASGRVVAARLRGKPVAVKSFKSKSSDGRSSDEVAVLRRVAHPDVVRAVGVVPADAPGAGAGGARVVMELLPGARPLGRPPTFDSVVRDVPPAEPLSEAEAVAAVAAVARALRHLHAQGVAHGDVYAHNVLRAAGAGPGGPAVAKLGDFGAAWAVPPSEAAEVEQAEVRAYGALVEDVAEWCGRCGEAVRARMAALARSCREGGDVRFDSVVPKAEAVGEG